MDWKPTPEERLFQLRWDLRYYQGQAQICATPEILRQIEKHQRMINELTTQLSDRDN